MEISDSSGIVILAGKSILNSPYRSFNFGVGVNYEQFFIRDSSNKTRFDFVSNRASDLTSLSLKDNNGSELFKLSSFISSGVQKPYIHLPFSNSRIVIGGYGDYLIGEGHNFIVRHGSSLFEKDAFFDGFVGIGTNSFIDGNDEYRLSVNGRIRAKAVKVYTGWADFVFDNSYCLPPLFEVEKFIAENGHLKDIPSAEDVESNGIELGEMNKLLLQKIEELTLYTIQQQKEIEELKSIIKKI